jgi:hypothetical protein
VKTSDLTRIIKYVLYAALAEETRSRSILVGKPKDKKKLWILRPTYEGSIDMVTKYDLKYMKCYGCGTMVTFQRKCSTKGGKYFTS